MVYVITDLEEGTPVGVFRSKTKALRAVLPPRSRQLRTATTELDRDSIAFVGHYSVAAFELDTLYGG